nr:unnamed protein product [Callosobruchus chinensis]
MDNELSYSSLNTYRAALNLIIHQSSNDDKILKRYWKGVYNIRPPKPKYQSTWDPQPVLSFLKGLNPLDSLSLELLTKKIVMLLALSSGHKVQTLSKISLNNIIKFEDRIEIKISKRTKTHSTRHAATSAAFRSGIKIDTIRNYAGWTETFDVFHKFYNRPVTESRIEFAKALLRTDYLDIGSNNVDCYISKI